MVQRDHKYATPPPAKQFQVFLATAPTDVLTAGTAEIRKTKFMGKVLHIYGKRRRCTIAGITVLWCSCVRASICTQQKFQPTEIDYKSLHH